MFLIPRYVDFTFKVVCIILIFFEVCQAANTVPQNIAVEQNCGKLLELNEPISEVFIANPEIADVQVTGSTAVNVFGRKPGNTTLLVTSTDNKIIGKVNIEVTHNLGHLKQTTKNSFPDTDVNFSSTPSGIIIHGKTPSPTIAKEIDSIASNYVAAGQKTNNLMNITGSTQVLLKVKVAEVKRSVLNKFDINWATLINNPSRFTYGIFNGRDPYSNGAFQRSTSTPLPGSYGFRYQDGKGSYTALLDALDSEGLGTILAEPNLITTSGETASFLVGGEFPYPVPQDRNITIEFKKFGTSLSFTPTVLSPDRIFLKVRPEVSELDRENSLSFLIGDTNVVQLPGIKTSVVETAVELADGQGLAIAGLISSSMANTYSDLPGIANIPILGMLFRSSQFQRNQTELVVIITPYIIKPTSNPNQLSLPTDKIRHASAFEALLFKRLNKEKINYDNDGTEEIEHFHGAAGFNLE